MPLNSMGEFGINVRTNRFDRLGIALVALGILFNRWLIEKIFVPDQHLESGLFVALISLGQTFLLLCGVVLLRKESFLAYAKAASSRFKGVRSRFKEYRYGAVFLFGILGFGAIFSGFVWYWQVPLVQFFDLPDSFSRRSGEMTVNIAGVISSFTKEVRFRVNDGQWQEVARGAPRAPMPQFLIEMDARKLRAGTNILSIEASAFGRPPQSYQRQFKYDPSPVSLPITKNWLNSEVEAYDGYWEKVLSDGVWRVRPKPGFEGYDRILVVTGAFSEGRRIETDVIFRHKIGGGEFGFGVLPLWGGHPDDAIHNGPRRGWNFSIVWYWNRYRGVGNEFSYKFGEAPPDWVNSYHNLALEAGARYAIVAECWPEFDENGKHLRYAQRSKWWKEGTPEPKDWLELIDAVGSPLPAGEYGVALVAYNCQVDFGPIKVEPLAAPQQTD
jgi:hypothetical protein